MDEFFSFINQGWFGIFGGLIISYFFYKRSLVGGRPVYQYRSTRLLGRDNLNISDKVAILFDNKEVFRLTKTILVFWNNGNKTIDSKDIVEELKFIVADGEKILLTRVVKSTRKITNFHAVMNGNSDSEAVIMFDFLDPKDGAIVEVLHTDKSLDVTVQGIIKGIPKGIRNFGRIQMKTRRNKFALIKEIFSLAFTVFGFIFVYISHKMGISGFSDFGFKMFVVVFGFMFGSVFILSLWEKAKSFPKELQYDEME